MYHYSSQLTLDAEDHSLFNDEDFSKISGLHQVRWASSQARALSKIDNNFFIICMRLENVAADRTHKRIEECEGLLNHIIGLKFLKMLMFLLDLHDIMKFLSLQFQKNPAVATCPSITGKISS
jgi:hypothetical protein